MTDIETDIEVRYAERVARIDVSIADIDRYLAGSKPSVARMLSMPWPAANPQSKPLSSGC